jgi:hypothetical protein
MRCYICKERRGTEEHHVFEGTHNRHKSEEWGMTAYLCPECHRLGKDSVHGNPKRNLWLKEEFQRKFEEEHDRETFMREFGRSYL